MKIVVKNKMKQIIVYQQSINDDKQSKKVLQDLHDKKVGDLKKEYEQQENNFNEQIKLLNKSKILKLNNNSKRS